jgi:replicative DNA helicase
MNEGLKARISYPADFHREFPQAPDSEKALISCIVKDPDTTFGMLSDAGFTSDDFYVPAHQEIYTAIYRMWTEMQPIEFIGICQHLKDRNKLDQVGGASNISEIIHSCPSASLGSHYLKAVQSKAVSRSIIKVCNEYSARAYEEHENPSALLAETEGAVLAIGAKSAKTSYVPMRQLAQESAARIERQVARKGKPDGLLTGFTQVDRLIGGMKPPDVFVLAARPSTGKTALAMNIVESVAIDSDVPTAVFSLEMSTEQLIDRTATGMAHVSSTNVRNGTMHDSDWPKLSYAFSKLQKAPIYFCDKQAISPAYIMAVLRRWKKAYGIGFVMIDYLQLMRGSKQYKGDNRQQEVAEISGSIKAMAKELQIPILVLAQLNRDADKRTGSSRGKPRLSDLRESGSIEQDADIVGLLSREEMYAENDEDRREAFGKAVLDIAKHRNGPTGEVNLTFIKEWTRFESRAETDNQ